MLDIVKIQFEKSLDRIETNSDEMEFQKELELEF